MPRAAFLRLAFAFLIAGPGLRSSPAGPHKHLLLDSRLIVSSRNITIDVGHDRLGYLQPFVASPGRPEVISSLIDTGGQPVTVSVNASGLNEWSKLKVSILNEQFGELAGFRPDDCTGPAKAGLRERVSWRGQGTVTARGPFRIKVNFAGIRPEDIRLYALYVTPAVSGPHSE